MTPEEVLKWEEDIKNLALAKLKKKNAKVIIQIH